MATQMAERLGQPPRRRPHTPVEPSERSLETIRGLLRTFNDARETCFGSASAAGDVDGAVTLMPLVWNQGSYAPLELLLKRMHSLGRQQAVDGIPLGTLWWHLAQRYLMAEEKVVYRVGGRDVEALIRRPRCICGQKLYDLEHARGHVQAAHKPVPVRVAIYTKEYQAALASAPRCKCCEELGVHWLGREFIRIGVTPQLPLAFLSERREHA